MKAAAKTINWPLLPLPNENGHMQFPNLDESVRQSIKIILRTRPGERIMRPAFGGGLELASQAVEVFGGNGYIENWPTARQLRDAQCHTIWEGTENIICLDVLRSMVKDSAHDALLDRIDGALDVATHPVLAPTRDAIAQARRDAQEVIAFLSHADDDIRQLHARRAGTLLSDLAQAALLLEAAQEELDSTGSARKTAVARFFVRDRLVAGHPLRGIDEDRSVLDLFESITRYAPVDPDVIPSGV